MSRIFLSHSSLDNYEAIALRDWLFQEGWKDVFLDIDPDSGIEAGQRWERRLHEAASRCEAVVFLVSANWLASGWCLKEYTTARRLNKTLFAIIIEPGKTSKDLPPELTDTWQVINLAAGQDMQIFRATRPDSHEEKHVGFSRDGLGRLKRGLQKAGLDPHFFVWPPAHEPERAPYRGLKPLEAADAGIFFGRDAPIVEATDRLRGLGIGAPPRLMVILGASGAGKSSFLRAGLLPRLARDDTHFVPLRPIRPELAAITGENGLIAALEAACGTRTRAELRTAVRSGAAGLRPILEELAQTTFRQTLAEVGTTKPPAVVIAIDQAEELFRTEGAGEAQALLALVRDLTTSDAGVPLIVIFAIRSDSYDALEHAKPLEGLRQDALPLLPMPRGAFKDVIEGPARRRAESSRKLTIEPQLTERLLEDIAKGSGSDALPLLAFTLEQLFLEYHRSGSLKLSDYEAIGGLGGAIDAAVERALVRADSDPGIPRGRAARETLMRSGPIPWLAGIDPDTRSPRRNIARLTDIPAESAPLIRLLVEERLLSTDTTRVKDPVSGTDTRVTTIEATHEALMRQWSLLAGWLTQDFGLLTTLEGVKRAARDWDGNARDAAWLTYRGQRLAEAVALHNRKDISAKLDLVDRAFLSECQNEEGSERIQKEAALQRENDRLNDVAAAQKRTARFQKSARRYLGLLACVLIIGFMLIAWQQLRLRDQRAVITNGQINLFAELAKAERRGENWDSALKLAVRGVRLGLQAPQAEIDLQLAKEELWAATSQSMWQLNISKHDDWVSTAVFDHPGEHILTSSVDKTAKIFDATAGKQIMVFRGHTEAVRSAAYNHKNDRVVTASSDKTARIWNARTGQSLGILKGHGSDVEYAVYSPDDRHILTASFDHTAIIWDAGSEQPVMRLVGHEDWIFTAEYNFDGSRIVTASQDKTARVWNASDGQMELVLRGHEEPIYYASFSPDGTRIVTASGDGTAIIWDAKTGVIMSVLRGHQDYINSAVFSPDGRYILTASSDKTARLWDSYSGSQIRVYRGHEDYLNRAFFSFDGLRFVTAAKDKTARVWDVARHSELATFRGHTKSVYSVAFDPSGKRLATASADKTARVWNIASVVTSAVFEGRGSALRAAAFAPDQIHLVIASQDRSARIWDLATKQETMSLDGNQNWVLSANYSPDGSRIVTASWDTTVRVWDPTTGHELMRLEGHTAPVWSASFNHDGTRIVSASRDKTARIWDAATGRLLKIIGDRDSRLWSAAFSPDGTRVVTSGDDDDARVWDATSGALVSTMRGHEGAIFSAAFNFDGSRVVTASADKTARIWDAATGAQVGLLLGHDQEVLSAQYSPDGRQIATSSSDKTARLWNALQNPVTTKQLLEEACGRKLGSLSVLDRNEMRLAGYPDSTPVVDVCDGSV